MADRPIIFSAPMVRALIEGRKTQTRRALKPQPPPSARYAGVRFATGLPDCWFFNPPFAVREVYAVGDRLWVREAWQFSRQEYCDCPQPSEPSPCDDWLEGTGCRSNRSGIDYRADAARPVRWRPSIHMPRWASRLTLTVTDVRVQRLQEITSADAIAEGCLPYANSQTIDCATLDPRDDFASLWNSLHGPAAWDANPWVCAVTFTVERRNIDAARTPPEGGAG